MHRAIRVVWRWVGTHPAMSYHWYILQNLFLPLITSFPSHHLWIFFNVYVLSHDRKIFWDDLIASPLFSLPNTIIRGDLNFTIFPSASWGLFIRYDPLYDYFESIIGRFHFVDIEPLIPDPTWSNHRVGNDHIFKRIRRES